MSKEKAIVHINNVSKMIGSKRIKLSEGMIFLAMIWQTEKTKNSYAR